MNDNLKEALLAANKRTVKHGGRTWKLDCWEHTGRFHCSAQNMTPQDAEEAKFCITDIWSSDSDHAVGLLYKFATLGGWKQTAAGWTSEHVAEPNSNAGVEQPFPAGRWSGGAR